MTQELKDIILHSDEVVKITRRLIDYDAPVGRLHYEAIEKADEVGNPGPEIAIRIVCKYLQEKLDALEKECRPTNNWMKIAKALAVLFNWKK